MISFFLGFIGVIGFYHLFFKLNKPASRWRSIALMTVVVLGYPLCQLYENIFFYKSSVIAPLVNMTIINTFLFLLIIVLLGNNRFRALVSASFIFSICFLAQIPVINFILAFVKPEIYTLDFLIDKLKIPEIYYSGLSFVFIIVTVCCLLTAYWLRKAMLKPPLKTSIIFILLFIFFTLIITIWFNDFIKETHISFLSTAFMGTLFIGILLFIFYMYTRLIRENLTVNIQKNVNIGEYKKYIKHLSKRELDVVEAVLAGNYTYKELSKNLSISVNTVKTHLKNIYQTTGVSNITALSSLFNGFTSNHP
jgi:DNA-binding CsgD family transcriptional regulator